MKLNEWKTQNQFKPEGEAQPGVPGPGVRGASALRAPHPGNSTKSAPKNEEMAGTDCVTWARSLHAQRAQRKATGRILTVLAPKERHRSSCGPGRDGHHAPASGTGLVVKTHQPAVSHWLWLSPARTS